MTNNNKKLVEATRATPNRGKKKVLSLTTGFSIRRNINNTDNPYTVTVLTRPFDEYNKLIKSEVTESNSVSKENVNRYYYDTSSDSTKGSVEIKTRQTNPNSTPQSLRRSDVVPSEIDEYDIPIYVRPTTRIRSTSSKTPFTLSTIISTTPSSTTEHIKYHIKSTSTPTPIIHNYNIDYLEPTLNSISTEALIEANLKNTQLEESNHSFDVSEKRSKHRQYERQRNFWDEPIVSPYKSLDNIRNIYSDNADTFEDFTSSTSSTVPSTSTLYSTTSTTPIPRTVTTHIPKRNQKSRSKSSYYSYRIEDEVIPDQTTEILKGKVGNVIRAFINNFVSTPVPRLIEEISSTTMEPSMSSKKTEDKVINIGFQKKYTKYIEDKPTPKNIKRIQIITEPSFNEQIIPSPDTISITDNFNVVTNNFSITTTPKTTTMSNSIPYIFTNASTQPMRIESTTNKILRTLSKNTYHSRFNTLITSKPNEEGSQNYQKILTEEPSTPIVVAHNESGDQVIPTRANEVKILTDPEWHKPVSEIANEIASTTSTTKATSTINIAPTSTTTSTTTMTKSISFPTRASRVNPAIKLAATNPGSGRRSYQSSSKCSSDNSLQANPKCNEIKYQRYFTRRPVV